jgi:hypothetical protein
MRPPWVGARAIGAEDAASCCTERATARNERLGGNRYSDQEKFRNDLNRPNCCEMSEGLLKTLQNSGNFQAEYEGSNPFTRSK